MQAENPDVTPQALHTFYGPDGGVLGHLVVDSSICGVSAGGIRMVPEMPTADLCHLARAMTRKYAFLKWPFGGAKAAILTHRDTLNSAERQATVGAFAERLAPFAGRYLPGVDAGTNDDDLRLICRKAGLMRPRAIPDSGYFTALTVQLCTAQVAAAQGIALAGCRVAIEGFGKVGGALARQLAQRGCRIVAVSTDRGAVYDPNGLDIDRLLHTRETAGSDCVNQVTDGRRIAIGELLTLPTDILIPCALSWSVTNANAGDIQARALVCGANNPVTQTARAALADRGVPTFPDFVSNCGGVLGSLIGSLGLPAARIEAIIRALFVPKVEVLMAHAARTDQSWEATALEIAEANLGMMKQKEGRPPNRLSAWIVDVTRRGWVPQSLTRWFGPGVIRRTMA